MFLFGGGGGGGGGGGCEILPSLIMMMYLVVGVAYYSLISLNMHHTLLESR